MAFSTHYDRVAGQNCTILKAHNLFSTVRYEDGSMATQFNNALRIRVSGLVSTLVPQQAQRQDSTNDQLRDLQVIANHLGMYDASDIIRGLLERSKV